MKVHSTFLLIIFLLAGSGSTRAQLKWINVDSLYGPLPTGVHVYRSVSPIEGKPGNAYYLEAPLKNRELDFYADTSRGRRLTPNQFYQKNGAPLLVVNTSFFSFSTNQNLNVIIHRGKLLAYNVHAMPGRGKDTFTFRHPFGSALGISKSRRADVAWILTDSARRRAWASQEPLPAYRDSFLVVQRKKIKNHFSPWKMETAVGGGPVLVQDGRVRITNNEELRFAGKAIDDRHPRTAMGYTEDGRLIVLVVEGRHPGIAEGASLVHLANIFLDLGCVEAINLDGGGSSCLLVNGKETIKVSDSGGQRPVPGVFIIRER